MRLARRGLCSEQILEHMEYERGRERGGERGSEAEKRGWHVGCSVGRFWRVLCWQILRRGGGTEADTMSAVSRRFWSTSCTT